MTNPCVDMDGSEEIEMTLNLTRDPSAAEDLVQDTFVRAYRFFGRYAKGTNCRAWLYAFSRTPS